MGDCGIRCVSDVMPIPQESCSEEHVFVHDRVLGKAAHLREDVPVDGRTCVGEEEGSNSHRADVGRRNGAGSRRVIGRSRESLEGIGVWLRDLPGIRCADEREVKGADQRIKPVVPVRQAVLSHEYQDVSGRKGGTLVPYCAMAECPPRNVDDLSTGSLEYLSRAVRAAGVENNQLNLRQCLVAQRDDEAIGVVARIQRRQDYGCWAHITTVAPPTANELRRAIHEGRSTAHRPPCEVGENPIGTSAENRCAQCPQVLGIPDVRSERLTQTPLSRPHRAEVNQHGSFEVP